MKRHLRPLAVAALSFLALSCSKEGVKLFEGSWSFKTSGTITYEVPPEDETISPEDDATPSVDETTPSEDEAAQPEAKKISLLAESGQMHIEKVSDDRMVVTLNAIGGDVVVFDADVSPKRIDLQPLERTVTLAGGNLAPSKAEVTVSGYGERYGDVIVFRLFYEGTVPYLNDTYKITDSKVECVATLNK